MIIYLIRKLKERKLWKEYCRLNNKGKRLEAEVFRRVNL